MEREELLEVEISQIAEPERPVREKMSEEGLEELSRSLRQVGLINPITLVRRGSGYEIDKGHRRFLAAKSLGWKSIKAIVREGDGNDLTVGRLHENLFKEDMSPVEEGRAVKRLVDEYGYSKKDVGRMCSKSESWIDGRIALLEMPVELQEAVDVGALSVAAARELNGIKDDAARKYHLEYALKTGATAALCAFWRSRWEVERVVNDGTEASAGGQSFTPPPLEVLMRCVWCEEEVPIRLIEHLRVCPKCLVALLQARQIAAQEAFEELSLEKEKVARSSPP